MRLGLIARADNTGLGNQTYEFYRHMNPDKTMVVDISSLNGNRQYPERYPDAQFVHGFPNKGAIEEFLQDLDVVFVAESPYNYWLYERAKQLGVKVAVQYNYEFFDWYSHPHYPTPDMLIAPSFWHYDKVEEFAKARGIKHLYLHCPVNRDVLPFVPKRKAINFLHIAGKPAAHDRNGTESAIEAFKLTKNPDIRLNVAVQSAPKITEYIPLADGDQRIKFFDTSMLADYTELYRDQDVLLFPRRYGGNCLPLNEALSTGMPVIMTDVAPNNVWLPEDWLVRSRKVGEFKPRMVIDIMEADKYSLSEKIDDFANMDIKDMAAQSIIANKLAERISWRNLAPQYMKAFMELLHGE